MPGKLNPGWDILDIGRWRRIIHRDSEAEDSEYLETKEPCKTLPDLVEFLRTRPELASHVKQLSLHCFPHCLFSRLLPKSRELTTLLIVLDVDFSDEGTFKLPTVWPYYNDPGKFIPLPLLFSVLQALPHLNALRFRDMFLQNVETDPASDALELPLTSLDRLSISYPPAHILSGIPSLSSIINLPFKANKLQIALHGSETLPVATSRSHFSQLDTLVLSSISCVSGLPQHFMGLNVRNLTLLSPKCVDFSRYNRYFREMGHTLRHLCVQIGEAGSSPRGAYISAKYTYVRVN